MRRDLRSLEPRLIRSPSAALWCVPRGNDDRALRAPRPAWCVRAPAPPAPWRWQTTRPSSAADDAIARPTRRRARSLPPRPRHGMLGVYAQAAPNNPRQPPSPAGGARRQSPDTPGADVVAGLGGGFKRRYEPNAGPIARRAGDDRRAPRTPADVGPRWFCVEPSALEQTVATFDAAAATHRALADGHRRGPRRTTWPGRERAEPAPSTPPKEREKRDSLLCDGDTVGAVLGSVFDSLSLSLPPTPALPRRPVNVSYEQTQSDWARRPSSPSWARGSPVVSAAVAKRAAG